MNRFTTILFFALVAELALGGGGRLTAFGPISLRMILFSLALLTTLFHLVKGEKIPPDYTRLLLFFALASAAALIMGISSGAERTFWWQDIKPLLYFLILPFFALAVKDITYIERTSTLLKTAGVLQALAFIAVLLLIHLHIIPFLSLYKAFLRTEEFFFRGELTFTYKGFLFLSIAFLFLHFTESKYKLLLMGLVLVALLLTVTRGFWLALLGTYSVYYFTRTVSSSKIKAALFALCALAVIFGGKALVGKTSETIDRVQSQNTGIPISSPKATLLGDRAYSDNGRLQQITEVAKSITPTSALIGHGFGNGVTSRPVHMEISYLEIFHKQGILGLALWAYLFWLLFKKYRAAPESGFREAFFFSALFIFIQSLTNQYINNPIGLSMILLSMVCLDVLKKETA
ncbi:MAG: hypothetical protein DI539_11250 [Flavobacterium psychrophilum]|nr:MAG: hypothetical protein DI539_11250 [Flavobacterium psychrophilum]